jgi:serine/threonine protein kinase
VSVLGRGTDSFVYRGVELADGTTPIPIIGQPSNGVAIKFQMYADSARKYSVETEFAVLSQTSSSPLFPKVYYLSNLGSIVIGIEQKNLRFLAMELLGGSILTLLRNYHYKLPMETVASIGIQAVDILETLHGLNLIHGDIHLENILFKVEGGQDLVEINNELISSQIVFGDYGKSVYYIDPESGQHVDDEPIEFSNERNMLFLSPYELGFGSPSRREDIFRLMETLARMIDQETYANYFRPFASNREAILNAKQTVALGEILRGIHPVFSALYDYSRSLSFTDRPDYDRMRASFTQLLQGQGLVYSGKVILPTRR